MANLRLTAESSGLVKEVKKARQEMKNLEAQYKNNMSAAELLGTKEEKLTAKINASNKINNQREQAMNRYRAAMDNLEKEIHQWTAEEQRLIKELEKARQAEGDNSKSVKDLEKQLKTLRGQIENNEKVLNDVSKSYYDTSAAVNDTTKDIEEFGEEAEEGVTAVFSLQDALSSAADMLRDFGDMIDGITNKFEDLIKNGIEATVDALANLGEYALTTGVNFEKQMSSVAAIMGISKSSGDFSKLTDAAKHYGETTQFTATQAAEALTYLAQAGKKTDEAIGLLPNILNLATAGNLDLGQASSYLVDAESALGDMVSQDVTGFVDKMAKAATETNTSVALMFEAVLGLGTVGRDLELNELIATLAKLGDYYLKGSEGGTKLRNVMLSLQSPTADAAKVLSELGVEIYDVATGDMRGIGEIFTELNVAMKDFTKQKKNNVFNTLFNKRDVTSAKALGIEMEGLAEYAMELSEGINKIDVTNIDNYEGSLAELVSTLENCDGAAQNMANTMRDNLWGSLKNLESAVEGFGLSVFDSIVPGVRAAVDGVVVYIREIIKGLSADASTIHILKVWEPDSMILNGASLKTHFEKISKAVSDLAARVPKILSAHTPKLISVFGKIIDIVVKFLEYLPVIIDQLLPALLTHIDNLLGKIPKFVDIVLPKILNFIEFIINNLPIVMAALYGLQGASALGAFALDIGGMVAGIAIAAQAAGTSIGALASSVGAALGAIASAAAPVLAVIAAIVAVIGTAYATSENFRNYVSGALSNIKERVSDCFGTIFESFSDMFENMGITMNAGQTLLNWFLGAVEIISTTIVYLVSQLINIGVGFTEQLYIFITGAVSTIYNAVLALSAFLSGETEKAKVFWGNTVNAFTNMMNDSWNSARETCKDFAGDFGDFLIQLKNITNDTSLKIKIESDLDVQSFKNDINMIATWGLPGFDPSKYTDLMDSAAIAMMTNGGKGWGSSSSGSNADYVANIMNGINNATANISNTNSNKVTSNHNDNRVTQNFNIVQPDPMDPNELFKMSRDQLASTQFKAQ